MGLIPQEQAGADRDDEADAVADPSIGSDTSVQRGVVLLEPGLGQLGEATRLI
jgi:hypothetical protein